MWNRCFISYICDSNKKIMLFKQKKFNLLYRFFNRILVGIEWLSLLEHKIIDRSIYNQSRRRIFDYAIQLVSETKKRLIEYIKKFIIVIWWYIGGR